MKNSISLARFLIVLSFVVISNRAAAQGKTARSTFDSLKAVKEIAGENEIYKAALAKSDSSAVAGCYTNNAEMLMDGSPTISGKTAIQHFYSGLISHGVTGFGYVTTGVLGSDNNLIMEEGTLTFSLTGGKVVSRGRYLLFWKRENGGLKIFRDTFFSDGK